MQLMEGVGVVALVVVRRVDSVNELGGNMSAIVTADLFMYLLSFQPFVFMYAMPSITNGNKISLLDQYFMNLDYIANVSVFFHRVYCYCYRSYFYL